MIYFEPREDVDQAIIGQHLGRNVYEYTLLVKAFAEHFMKSDETLEMWQAMDNAQDWIDYNIVGSLPQAFGEEPPFVVYSPDLDENGDVFEEILEACDLIILNGRTWVCM